MTEFTMTGAVGSRTAAAEHAELQATPDPTAVAMGQPGTDPGMSALPVDLIGGEGGIFSTAIVNAGASRPLLPQDSRRRMAIIVAIDEPVVLCQTLELAQNAANNAAGVPQPVGFYLPVGQPIPIRSRGAVYVANTSTSTPTRVSMAVERIESPDPLQ